MSREYHRPIFGLLGVIAVFILLSFAEEHFPFVRNYSRVVFVVLLPVMLYFTAEIQHIRRKLWANDDEFERRYDDTRNRD